MAHILIGMLVTAVLGAAFWAYRVALTHYEQNIIERHEAEQREQERARKTALGVVTPVAGAHNARPSEIEGVPLDIYEAECAEVLAQLASLRRESRRHEKRYGSRRLASNK